MIIDKNFLKGAVVAMMLLVGNASSYASEVPQSIQEAPQVLEEQPKVDFEKVIFSFDGGGSRGLFQALFLQYLEDRVRQKTKAPDLKIGECIDFIAGTSTGSITGGVLSYPDPKNPLKPKYSANYLVNFFNDNIHKVFKRGLFKTVFSGVGILDEKYSDKGFNKLLVKLFSDTPLSEACTPILITTCELSDQEQGTRPYLFMSHNKNLEHVPEAGMVPCSNDKECDLSDVTFAEAIRSSGAAPTYFERNEIKGKSGQKYYFVDGGMTGANNPAPISYLYGKKYFDENCGEDKIKKKDYFCLSIGTGKAPLYIDGYGSKDYGLLQWAPSLIPMMLDAPSMLSEDSMKGIFSPLNGKYHYNYRRFQPTLKNPIDLADTSAEALTTMKTVANQYIIDNMNDFEHTANVLAARYRAKNIPVSGLKSSNSYNESNDNLIG